MHSHIRTILAALALILAAVPATAQQTPDMPTRLWAGQTSASQVQLRWDTVPGAAEYRLYQRTSATQVTRIATAARNAQSWVIPLKSSMAGTTLQYQLSAVHPKLGESAIVPFNPVTIVMGAAVPAAPTAVMAALSDTNEITLRWDSVPGATGYAISRSITPYGFSTLCAFCPAANSYVDNAVTFGQGHTYTVEAISPGGRSRRVTSNMVGVPLRGSSGIATALLGVIKGMTAARGSGLRVPGPPVVEQTIVAPGSVTVRWLPINADSATAFVLERAVNLGNFQNVGTFPADQREYIDRSLPQVYENGRMRLTYRLFARNRLGTSPIGAETWALITNPGAPNTTSSCDVEYRRANTMWANSGSVTPLPGLETLRVKPDSSRMFNSDWSYENTKNNGRAYYGSHLRRFMNVGPRMVIIYVRSLDPTVVYHTIDVAGFRNPMDLVMQTVRNTLALTATRRHGIFVVEIKVRPGDVIGLRGDLLEVMCPRI